MPASPSLTPPAARRAGPPAAAVLTAARGGPAFRDRLAHATGLSTATVNRQVAALLAAGLLRERPDLVRDGTVGRPRVPVEVDPDGPAVLGLHLGLRRCTLAVGDLRGRVLATVDVPRPDGPPAEVLAGLARRLLTLAGRLPRRRILQVGVVTGGDVSRESGTVGHPALGWEGVPVAELVGRVVDAEVVVVPQVEAMVQADVLLARPDPRGTTLYVYARDAVGAVLTVDGVTEVPGRLLGTIGHLPVGGDAVCRCGARGCLEASVSDAALADAAARAGIGGATSAARVVQAARDGDGAARALLEERARMLGRGVALARDVLDPDRVVLLGQAFTAYRPGLAHVSAAFAARSVLAPLTLQVSPLGAGVQAVAACTAAVRPVLADPLRVAARAGTRDGAVRAWREAAG